VITRGFSEVNVGMCKKRGAFGAVHEREKIGNVKCAKYNVGRFETKLARVTYVSSSLCSFNQNANRKKEAEGMRCLLTRKVSRYYVYLI
jgi:hypothetical protein